MNYAIIQTQTLFLDVTQTLWKNTILFILRAHLKFLVFLKRQFIAGGRLAALQQEWVCGRPFPLRLHGPDK